MLLRCLAVGASGQTGTMRSQCLYQIPGGSISGLKIAKKLTI